MFWLVLICHYVILVFFLQFSSIVQFRFVALILTMSCLCVFIVPGLSQSVTFLVYFLDKKRGERPRKSKCCIMNSFLFHAIYQFASTVNLFKYICIYIYIDWAKLATSVVRALWHGMMLSRPLAWSTREGINVRICVSLSQVSALH